MHLCGIRGIPATVPNGGYLLSPRALLSWKEAITLVHWCLRLLKPCRNDSPCSFDLRPGPRKPSVRNFRRRREWPLLVSDVSVGARFCGYTFATEGTGCCRWRIRKPGRLRRSRRQFHLPFQWCRNVSPAHAGCPAIRRRVYLVFLQHLIRQIHGSALEFGRVLELDVLGYWYLHELTSEVLFGRGRTVRKA